MNNNAMLGSAHRDVLQAPIPDSVASKASLINELQSRGRAVCVSKSWMEGKMLYEKAIAVCSSCTDDEASQMPTHVSVFHSNLSLVLRNMGEWEPARQAAEQATTSDPSYVKGWWRLGQALQTLHRQQDALSALQTALKLDPDNKALKKENDKVAKLVKEEMDAADSATDGVAAMQVDEETSKTVKKSASKTDAPKPITKKTSSSPKKTTTETDDESKIFSKSDAVRGYKIVNGKKTSYFHNELSEEAKNLIGDIAPKKLEAASAPTPVESDAKSGTSAWNKAGTWEEKDVTKWAISSLKEEIMKATCVLPDSCGAAAGGLVTVSDVSTVEGHASVAVARGKKRYIYELAVRGLNWNITKGDFECRGKLNVPDIDGTIEIGEGYEIEGFSIDHISDGSLRSKMDAAVRKDDFCEALCEGIDDWVKLFRDTYS